MSLRHASGGREDLGSSAELFTLVASVSDGGQAEKGFPPRLED